VLQICRFKARDPCASRIDRLRGSERPWRNVRRRLKIIENKCLGNNRVRKPFVEESTRDNSKRIEIVFDEDVEIVGGFRFQIWISEGQEIFKIS
jgi:hypothetical protein